MAIEMPSDYSRYTVDQDWDANPCLVCRTCGSEFAWTTWREEDEWTLKDLIRLADEHEREMHNAPVSGTRGPVPTRKDAND